MPTERYAPEELEEAESFMRNNDLTESNKDLMLTKLAITRELRQKSLNLSEVSASRRKAGNRPRSKDLNFDEFLGRWPLLVRALSAVRCFDLINVMFTLSFALPLYCFQ